MPQTGRRKARALRTQPWIKYGAGLLAALAGSAFLLYVNVFDVARGADEAALAAPAHAIARVPAGTPAAQATAQEFDEAYFRAVNAQIERIGARVETRVPALDATPTSVPRRAAPAVELQVITVGAELNVRAAPRISAPVIDSLPPGAVVRAVGVNADRTWIQARAARAGEPGWVYAGLVRLVTGRLDSLPLTDPEPDQERTRHE